MRYNFLTVVAGVLTALIFIDVVNYLTFEVNPILGSLIFYCGFLGLIIYIMIRERGVKNAKKR